MSDSGTAGGNEQLTETADRLRSAIDRSGRNESTDPPEQASEASNGPTESNETTPEAAESSPSPSDAVALVTRAETDLEDLLGIVRGDREGTLADAQEDLSDLIDVIDEAEDLLSTVDLSALPEAADWSDLPAAIEAGSIPEAIAKGDSSEAIDFQQLLSVVDLRTVLENVDLQALWQQKEDVEDAADDFTDEDEPNENEDDSSVFDRFGSDDESEGGSTSSDTTGSALVGSNENGEGGIPSELIEARVQSKLREAIESFRESALDARDRLKEMRDRSKQEFKEKTGEVGQPSSRNPTAYSTLPGSPDERADIGGVQRPSTIPRTPRHSSVPGHDRIYGGRFENRDQGDQQ